MHFAIVERKYPFVHPRGILLFRYVPQEKMYVFNLCMLKLDVGWQKLENHIFEQCVVTAVLLHCFLMSLLLFFFVLCNTHSLKMYLKLEQKEILGVKHFDLEIVIYKNQFLACEM
jgi:hypothetical protein